MHQQVAVNTNGYLVFTDDDDNAEDFKFEDNFGDQLFRGGATGNNLPIAAAFWHDLDIRDSDGLFTATRGAAPNRRFIVQYENYEHVITGFPRITFQIVLFESTVKSNFAMWMFPITKTSLLLE